MRGWSGRWDQVGGWGRRRVGGDEEAESRQQEAGRGDVDEGEARARRSPGSRKRVMQRDEGEVRERRRDRSDLYRTCSTGQRATPK